MRQAFCIERMFDVLTCAMSFSDIALDVVVAHEFWEQGRMNFFFMSLSIFAAAQASYAFLFVATYGTNLSNASKTIVYLLVLPLSQLVPCFTLLEAMQIPAIVGWLRACGLQPSAPTPTLPDSVDSFWLILQRKYHAHAGFLLEALVEAIPQCTLQVAAAVMRAQQGGTPVSPVAALSILLSLGVICSKGWLAAYSLHKPTFVFNVLAISSDVACLFATVAWLALSLASASVPSPLPEEHASSPLPEEHEEEHASSRLIASHLMSAYLWMVAAGVCLGALGGLAATLFSITDDHLKARHSSETGYSVPAVWYNVWLLRLLTWTLSLLPSVVLLATIRLSLLPLLAFRSLSSEQARHPHFFRALFAFLRDDKAHACHGEDCSANAAPEAPPALAAPAPCVQQCDECDYDGPDGAAIAAVSPARSPACSASAAAASPSGSAAVRLEDRIRIANILLAEACSDRAELARRLASGRSEDERRHCVISWVRTLGHLELPAPATLLSPTLPPPGAARPPASQVPATSPTPEVALWPRHDHRSLARLSGWQRRRAMLRFAASRRYAAGRAELLRRSEVFRRLCSDGLSRGRSPRLALCRATAPRASPPLGHPPEHSRPHMNFGAPPSLVGQAGPSAAAAGVARLEDCGDRALVALALAALALAAAAAVLAVPLLFLFLPLGAALPLLQLALSFAYASSLDTLGTVDFLPHLLTGVYLALQVLLLLLLPWVRSFQSIRADLVPTTELPDAFFIPEVVHEMARRYRLEQGICFQTQCTVCFEALRHGDSFVVLPRCSHAFHRACIEQWLAIDATCPNCRCPATVHGQIAGANGRGLV